MISCSQALQAAHSLTWRSSGCWYGLTLTQHPTGCARLLQRGPRERTSYSWEIVESCLAHSVGTTVAQAYNRGDMLDRRRQLMEEWAQYCSTPRPAGDLVAIREAR